MLIVNLLILITVLGVIIIINSNIKQEVEEENNNPIQYEIKPVSDNVEVFTVQKFIQEFLQQININNELYKRRVY